MKIDRANLSRLDLMLWAAVVAVAAVVFGAPAVSDFRIVWTSFLLPGGACVALVIAGRCGAVDGGHYFVDVLAGLAIAAGCWIGASAFVERALTHTRVLPIAAVQGTPLARD
jgi:hypothetical protein